MMHKDGCTWLLIEINQGNSGWISNKIILKKNDNVNQLPIMETFK